MDVKEMIARAQRLRRQLSDLQTKTDSTRQELTQLNKDLRQVLEESDATVAQLSEEEFQTMLAEFNDPRRISVEVAYATRDKQHVEAIQLSPGATIDDAITVSGILDSFPGVELTDCKVGIHGSIKPLTQTVQEGDRIEIYRAVESSATN